MGKQGKNSIMFENGVYLLERGTAVGPYEADGPLKDYFDLSYKDLYCGEKTWEKAEQRLFKDAIELIKSKRGITQEGIDLFLAGDLLNQNVTSNYVIRDYQVPFLGVYGACSTSIESMIIGSVFVDGGYFKNVIAATSSHNATAERQYRYPTEYGGPKPDTMTFTVTGAGAVLIGSEYSNIKIKSATIGEIVDCEQTNPLDMGSAMAPAAAETIKQHLNDFNLKPEYYDIIATGDLSKEGSNILLDILNDYGIDISKQHVDCGNLIFSDDQPVFAGGSGCACCAVVTYGYLISQMLKNKYKRILVVATGALLNPTMILQKETIPSIAHAICLEKL